jgi:hypothetical protein
MQLSLSRIKVLWLPLHLLTMLMMLTRRYLGFLKSRRPCKVACHVAGWVIIKVSS